MKRVTASEARRNWFRILDEVAAGEVIVIERNGRTIKLSRESAAGRVREVPDYTGLIRAPKAAEHAERWGWDWSEEEGEVRPVEHDRS
jgi:antitoxin (DNA-binding transcriptional repressor) of toxin-antitoxin stability system